MDGRPCENVSEASGRWTPFVNSSAQPPSDLAWGISPQLGSFFITSMKRRSRLLTKACLGEPEAERIRECFSADNQFYASIIWINKENRGSDAANNVCAGWYFLENSKNFCFSKGREIWLVTWNRQDWGRSNPKCCKDFTKSSASSSCFPLLLWIVAPSE